MTKIIQVGARIILGLIYAVFGGMGLAMVLGLMQMPQPAMPEGATAFMAGIAGAGYFIPVLKITETFCGLMLLCGCAAPLVLVILAPVTLQILLFHAFLTPGAENLILPLIMVAAHITAMSAYWAAYKPLFSGKSGAH